MVIPIFIRTFAPQNDKTLDSINDREKSETALADGETIILEDLEDFQDNVLNSPIKDCLISHWWFFLND